MEHDLSKLQEAHDKLMTQLEEQRVFTAKTHEQLDVVVEENNRLKLEIAEKEQDLKSVAAKLSSQEALRTELRECQDKTQKLKLLAAKYKKDLLECQEQLHSRNQDVTKELQKEIERISTAYQQSVRNFQVSLRVSRLTWN